MDKIKQCRLREDFWRIRRLMLEAQTLLNFKERKLKENERDEAILKFVKDHFPDFLEKKNKISPSFKNFLMGLFQKFETDFYDVK